MKRNLFEWMWFLIQEYGDSFLKGTWMTLLIAVIGTVLGYLLGFLIGVVQSTPDARPEDGTYKVGNRMLRSILVRLRKAWNRLPKFICTIFVEVFRGTPMMVQAMVLYYGLKTMGSAITPFQAAILVTLLNTGAYMAETVRGGILALDPGQQEGAKALGMGHFTTMFSVILPQAFRNIIPEMGNLFITNLKMTSVLNVVGISELYFVTKTASNMFYCYFEAFTLTGLIYLFLCIIFSRLMKLLEKKLDGDSHYELVEEA
ncbi:MAG: amino acid ABC transporter permease [Clostridium sp.]|jgi:putative lysine transport system permease protein|nr:amino acid ABC transporter permease [Clostridium sp.]